MQHQVLGGYARRQLPLQGDADTFGQCHAHRARDKCVGHVGGADAKCHAAQGPAVRCVRIGADKQLARQRVMFGHHGV